MDDRHARALMLVDYASRQATDDQKREIVAIALRTARSIVDSRMCARVLAEMSSRLESDQRRQALTDALNFIHSLPEADARGETLVEVAKYLDSDHLDQALDIAEALPGTGLALSLMAKHLKDHNDENRRALRIKALRIAREISNDETRAKALKDLVPYLDHDQLNDVLESIHQIDAEYTWDSLLRKLAPRLDGGQLDRALTLARSISTEPYRASALAAIGPYLSPEQLTTALAAANDIAEKDSRGRALAALTPLQTRPESVDGRTRVGD